MKSFIVKISYTYDEGAGSTCLFLPTQDGIQAMEFENLDKAAAAANDRYLISEALNLSGCDMDEDSVTTSIYSIELVK